MLQVCFDCYGSYTTDSVYQWDLNRRLAIRGLDYDSAPAIHFSNKKSTQALVVQSTIEDGVIYCDVPNILLQEPYDIVGYVCECLDQELTTHEMIRIPVKLRVKPADYAYENNVEILTYYSLMSEITSVKASTEKDIKSMDASKASKAELNAVKAEVESNLDTNINRVENEIASERARIDQLVALPEIGEGDLEKEVGDLRIDTEGTTHGSAGTAVRSQLRALGSKIDANTNQLSSDIVDLHNIGGAIFNINSGYWINANGAKYAHTSAKYTDRITVKEGQHFKIVSDAYQDAVAYILFNADGTVNSYEKNTVAGNYNAHDYYVTIPNGVTSMLCSCVNGDNGPFSVERIIDNEVGVIPSLLKKDEYFSEYIKNDDKNTTVALRGAVCDDYTSVSFDYTSHYIDSNCQTQKYDLSRTSDYVYVYDCDKIKITANCADGSKAYVFYDENKNIVSCYPPNNTDKFKETFNNVEIEVPLEAHYIRVSAVYSTVVDVKKRKTLSQVNDEVNDLSNKITSNFLANKKYVACGDSFTQGDFTGGTETDIYDSELKVYKTYPYWIAKRNNMVLVNEAICGSCLAHREGVTNALSDTRYTLVPVDADYITARIGLNDSSANIPIGTIDDTENTTFYGAWNVILDYWTENIPNAKIGIIVESAYLPNTYREACINIAKKWGVPYLDLYNDDKIPCIMNHANASTLIQNRRYAQYRVSESNGHPNMLAHKTMSTFIENWLRSL